MDAGALSNKQGQANFDTGTAKPDEKFSRGFGRFEDPVCCARGTLKKEVCIGLGCQ